MKAKILIISIILCLSGVITSTTLGIVKKDFEIIIIAIPFLILVVFFWTFLAEIIAKKYNLYRK